jgi:hypothetical protein
MEIIKVYKEKFRARKLIGKKYGPHDGGYAQKWGEWFQNNWFAPLEALIADFGEENAYIGFLRFPEGEYWIGVFASPSSEVPVGYQSILLPESEVAIAWIYGSDRSGEIYGAEAHRACLRRFREQGWELREGCCFERYVCPRFTTPDELGNVILDYGVFLN